MKIFWGLFSFSRRQIHSEQFLWLATVFLGTLIQAGIIASRLRSMGLVLITSWQRAGMKWLSKLFVTVIKSKAHTSCCHFFHLLRPFYWQLTFSKLSVCNLKKIFRFYISEYSRLCKFVNICVCIFLCCRWVIALVDAAARCKKRVSFLPFIFFSILAKSSA